MWFPLQWWFHQQWRAFSGFKNDGWKQSERHTATTNCGQDHSDEWQSRTIFHVMNFRFTSIYTYLHLITRDLWLKMCKMYILTTFKHSAKIINHKSEHFNHKSLTFIHIFLIFNFEFTMTSSQEILIWWPQGTLHWLLWNHPHWNKLEFT